MTALMNFLNSYQFINGYHYVYNFNLLFEREFNIHDNDNNTVLMYLCKNHPNIIYYKVFENIFI